MKKLIFLLAIASLALAEVIISPNMNLPVPIAGVTPGPQWADNVNSCMSAIDSHDHTPGHGVPISSSSLSINSDFPLNNNSLTQAKAVVFNSQTSFSTNQSVYVVSPDLIYNDGNGNVIRITQAGSVAGASGTITGLPSGTASASYQSVGGTFQFQSATNTPANGSFASISVAQQTSSPNTITIKSPNSLGASYNFTLPTSVPAFTSLLTMSTSGVLSTVAYLAPTIQKFLSGSGTYTTPSGPSPLYIKIKLVGGGGGGSGSGTSGAGNGGTGGTTSFGTSLLTSTGGAFGNWSTLDGGVGGSGTINSPAVGFTVAGGWGSAAATLGTSNTATTPAGGGGNSAFGGAGAPSNRTNGNTGETNSGSGGSGGGSQNISAFTAGAGGGAGAYIEAIINNPSATYSYAVGAAGSGGTAGTSGHVGGAGGSGLIVVEEHYQ